MKPALQKKGLRLRKSFSYDNKSPYILFQDETCPTEKGIATGCRLALGTSGILHDETRPT